MKDYEVNYVHQESKTIPDANYTFETAMTPAHMPRHEPIPTHKDVLLKMWARDTRAMAEAMVHKSSSGGWYALKTDNSILDWYKTYPEAIAAGIAYLNSAAEVGK